jgi:hypothetical protein
MSVSISMQTWHSVVGPCRFLQNCKLMIERFALAEQGPFEQNALSSVVVAGVRSAVRRPARNTSASHGRAVPAGLASQRADGYDAHNVPGRVRRGEAAPGCEQVARPRSAESGKRGRSTAGLVLLQSPVIPTASGNQTPSRMRRARIARRAAASYEIRESSEGSRRRPVRRPVPGRRTSFPNRRERAWRWNTRCR